MKNQNSHVTIAMIARVVLATIAIFSIVFPMESIGKIAIIVICVVLILFFFSFGRRSPWHTIVLTSDQKNKIRENGLESISKEVNKKSCIYALVSTHDTVEPVYISSDYIAELQEPDMLEALLEGRLQACCSICFIYEVIELRIQPDVANSISFAQG